MPIATATGATIEIDGKPLPADVRERVVEVVVEQDVHLPASFEIKIVDPERAADVGLPVKIASKVTVSGASVDGAPEPVLTGEVTALEAEYADRGSFFVIRGYDLAHRLHRGRRTKVFSQAKYSDIASQVASAAGLQAGTIDDSGQVKAHVPQVAQSDWAFLCELADEIDFELSVVDGKLNFRKPTDASQAPGVGTYGSTIPLQLIFGEDLLEFEPRLSAAGQVDIVEVRAWDPVSKQAIVGSAPAASTSVALKDTPAALSNPLGSSRYVSVQPRSIDQASADRRAARLAQLLGSTFAEAVGIARGNPAIRAGAAVSVSVVGAPFVGRYVLSHVRHAFDARGYRSHFTASGRQERSLLGLVGRTGPSRGEGPLDGGIRGVVTAVVTDVNDPSAAGRARLRFEWLAADYVSDWARVSMPGAGKVRGAVWLPEVGDEVLVAFEHGDVRRPVVIGGLWNGQDAAPPYGVPNGKPNARALVSMKGHKLVLHDEDNGESIELATAGGISIILDDVNHKVSIIASGSTKVSIEAGGDVAIASKANVTIAAGSKLTLTGQTGVELKSGATTVVKGQVLQLNPPG
jgi:uncharacterized protein involved in type VI secretion and phage assembly